MLEVIAELHSKGDLREFGEVIKRTGRRLSAEKDLELQQAILCCWHDLVRTGYIAWGRSLQMFDHPSCHVTTRGRETLKRLNRDPMNHEGYMNHLGREAKLGDIARSYIDEALRTYQAGCFKATAVLVGGAAESIVLEIRDELIAQMNQRTRQIPAKLKAWQAKTVFDALTAEVRKIQPGMTGKAQEAFDYYWPALFQNMRAARNDAGHPTAIDPVTPEAVHASLLLFPELARIGSEVHDFVRTHYH
jgi:hypothetical protein